MSASVLLVQLHDEALVVGNGKLRHREDGALVRLSGHARGVVVGTQRENDLLLDGRSLSDLLIDDFERDEIHVERHVGGVLDLRVEIEQSVVRVDAFQGILNPETLAADMLHFALVLLVDGLHDKTHEQRRLASQLREVNLHRIVRAVYGAAVMDEIAHLDVQQQRLGGIFHIERIERSVLGNDRHIGLDTEIAHGGFHTDHVLRAVSLARDKVRRTQIDVSHRRRKDDMDGLVVGNLQPVRGYHAVEREFPREAVIEVSVGLRLRIDLFLQDDLLRLLLRSGAALRITGYLLRAVLRRYLLLCIGCTDAR